MTWNSFTQRLPRFTSWISLVIAALVLLILLPTVLSGCAASNARDNPDDLAEFATANSITLSHAAGADQTLAYVSGGTPGQPLVIFVHGTPGTWHAFERYLRHPTLRARTHMIAVDRLGFGASAASGVQPNLKTHSTAIAELFAFNQSAQPITVVGHSLGGTIALQVIIDHPEQVDAILSISGALSPDLSAPRWYHRLADLPVIKHLIPDNLHLANEEMLTLRDGLAALEQDFEHITGRVSIIQGGKDPLVAAAHADFAEQQMLNADVTVHRFPESGHFIVWEQPDFVVDEILRLIDRTSGARY